VHSTRELVRLLLVAGLVTCGPVHVQAQLALAASYQRRDFHQTSWGSEDGIGAVFDVQQSRDGYLWLTTSRGVLRFDGVTFETLQDLSEPEQKLVWATQMVPAPDLFNQKVDGTAWRSKPSWYIVAKHDRTVHPELQRFAARRMGATTFEVDSSHVPMLSNPNVVLDVIRTAANAVQPRSTAARRA
jgi:pimeloyl-ACP methyl ester carboxylesterase